MPLTQEQFLQDVAQHQMTVLMDNGLYRHLRFAKPDSGDMRFNIVTYPGFLVYSGDMGCYVFERSEDMFQFFRASTINPWYWAEKLQAMNGNRATGGHVLKYDIEAVRAMIQERAQEWLQEIPEADAEAREGLQQALQELEGDLQDCETRDYDTLQEFEYIADTSDGPQRFVFTDLEWDNYRKMTFHYLWCCHALQWAIAQYDKAQEGREYVLVDTRSTVGNCMMFWREGGGYTTDLGAAERMTRETAMAQFNCRDTDMPWLHSELARIAKPRVDFQYKPRKYTEQAALLRAADALKNQPKPITGNQVSIEQKA